MGMTPTYSPIAGSVVVPVTPAGQFTMHVEGDVAIIERRYYGHRALGETTPDRVATFRIPVNALRELVGPR